jgi:hypothetical protein
LPSVGLFNGHDLTSLSSFEKTSGERAHSCYPGVQLETHPVSGPRNQTRFVQGAFLGQFAHAIAMPLEQKKNRNSLRGEFISIR